MNVTRQDPAEKVRRLGRWGMWALLSGLGYFLLAWLGNATLLRPEDVATVWPSSGLLVGLLAVRGRRDWPALVTGAFAGSWVASVTFGTSLELGACVALANMIEAILAVWLPERIRRAPLRMASVVDVLWFFLLSVLVAPALGAVLGGGVSAWLAGEPSWQRLHLWGMADGLGILLVTPFILALVHERRSSGPWNRSRLAEGAALLAVLSLGMTLIFSRVDASPMVIFPMLLWAALRFGVLGVASTMLPLSAVAFAQAALGNAMQSPLPGFGPYHLLDLQAFLSVTAMSALGLASALRERKQVEEALLDAQRRKDAFLAMLSHELRNPLAPIRNSLFILDRVLPEADQARRALAIIERQMAHLTRLVGDLLDVTRISHGKIELRRELLDLRDVVRRTVDDHRALFASHRIDLRVEQAHAPLWLNGDATRLTQALGNLLNNAIKFTPEGGRVSVVLRRQRSLARLSVKDTGQGLSPDTVAHLFEPFTQADQSLARSAGGLGLGLALAQGLIRLHGGRIEAASAGPGQGSEFIISIPVMTDEARDAEGRSEMRGAAQTARGLRVLVIEDSTDAAETLKEALELARHQVRVATNGPEGLARAHEFRPDVVLCDIGLPGMNGYDVARAFRRDQGLQRVALVALTGYASSDDRRKAAEAGFDQHVAKPPDLRLLERVLAELSA